MARRTRYIPQTYAHTSRRRQGLSRGMRRTLKIALWAGIIYAIFALNLYLIAFIVFLVAGLVAQGRNRYYLAQNRARARQMARAQRQATHNPRHPYDGL